MIQVDEEAQQRLLTAVTVLKMCSNTTGGSSRSQETDRVLARGDSGCFAWTDTESEVDLASVAIVHQRDTANSGLFVNKDFEDVPSSEEGEVAVVKDEEEENQSTDFMSKFANTLALFESEPKVNKTNSLVIFHVSIKVASKSLSSPPGEIDTSDWSKTTPSLPIHSCP